MLILSLAVAITAAPAPEHQSHVEQAIFELCPRALAGTLSLDDAAQVSAAGYEAAPARATPGGPMDQIGRGSGTERILISARREGGTGTCAVWFGGPDNREMLRAVRRRARTEGYRGRDPMRLGDGTPIQILQQAGGAQRALTIIEGNAGGDLEFAPVTTVITMTPR